jgi:hypothetical protein
MPIRRLVLGIAWILILSLVSACASGSGKPPEAGLRDPAFDPSPPLAAASVLRYFALGVALH